VPVKKDNGASKYCMKEESRIEGPWEYGTLSKKEGNKNAQKSTKDYRNLSDE